MQCGIKYNPFRYGSTLEYKFKKAVNNDNLDDFIKSLSKYSLNTPTEVNHNATTDYSQDENARALRVLITQLKGTLEGMMSGVDSVKKKLEVINQIETGLGILDKTQEKEYTAELEALNFSHEDTNLKDIEQHFYSTYGRSSYSVISAVKQSFADRVLKEAFFDSNTGILASIDNEELNANINAFKRELFENIWGYLRENHPDFPALRLMPYNPYDKGFMTEPRAYSIVMKAFYDKVLSNEDIQDKLRKARSSDELRKALEAKSGAFKSLVTEILTDSVKSKLRKRGYTDVQIDSIGDSLYYNGEVSNIVHDMMSILKDNEGQNSSVEALSILINQDYSLLGAVTSYTKLTQFDALLEDSFGGDIRIKNNMKGKEGTGNDKYSYGRDRSHEIKGWETSDNNDALKNTSRFTKTVIGSIRVYDNKTGNYKNKRVTPNSLVLASRKVIDSLTFRTQDVRVAYRESEERREAIPDAIKYFHLDPIENAYTLFNELFKKTKKEERPSDRLRRMRRGISEHDIDILYSIFKVVFDRDNLNSLYNQAHNTLLPYKQRQNAYSILAEIAGYIDRTVDASYSESAVNYEGGSFVPTFTIKRKFFDHADLSRMQRGITHFSNTLSNSRRAELISKGMYSYEENTSDEKRSFFSISIDGHKMELTTPNIVSVGIMSTATTSDNHSSLSGLDELEGVEPSDLNEKLKAGKELDDNERLYLSVLQFLEDTTGVAFRTNYAEFLPVLSNLNSIFKSSSSSDREWFTNPLQPLIRIGMRTLYAGKRALDYEASETKKNGGAFQDYLKNEGKDSIYLYSDPKQKVINTRYGEVSYNTATFKDKILDLFIEAQLISRGDVLQSATKDSEGNSIPNSSIARLGSNIHHYLYRDDVESINGSQKLNAYSNLAFYGDLSKAITAITQDLEIRNINGEVKKVSSMSPRELIYHSLINRFASPIAHGRGASIGVQPVVYSDKTNIITYHIDPIRLNQDSYLGEYGVLSYSLNDYIRLYVKTLGGYFYSIKKNTENTLLAAVREHFGNDAIDSTNYIEKMQQMSENDLVLAADRVGATVELNKDYLVVTNKKGNKVVTPNPLVQYNAEIFNNKDRLRVSLEMQLRNFIRDVLSTGITFDASSSQSPILAILSTKEEGRSIADLLVLNGTSKSNEDVYKKEWIDEGSGLLILAKQVTKDADGKEVKRNIIHEKDFDDSIENLEVNPLLRKFFLFDGFASNNLKLSLVGSELNMGNGKGSILNQVLSFKDTDNVKSMFNVDDATAQSILDKIISPSFDYYSFKKAVDNSTLDDDIRILLYSVLDSHNSYQTSFTQNAQGKRNVIIPATLQYPTQGHINGMPRRTRVAVIKDVEARANSYSGDSKDIDSADGSARMTPFQVIMENNALGSQAVGTVRKPIWHDIDLANGTSFLAKFAAMGMTNEDMRHSSLSKISLHNMFKKATNLQWAFGDVDLMKDIERESAFTENTEDEARAHRDWFNSHILNSGELYYVNAYGDVIQITLLSRDNDIYYTVESDKGFNSKKVYHLFDEQSKHHRFDSYEEAKAYIDDNPGITLHTINSLFELHTALGGIYSSDRDGKYNEFNNEVVVNFMNRIGSKRESAKSSSLSQENYRQPLKEYHTGYLLNTTATKKGVKNVNPSDSWYDDTPLTTYNVMSDGLGIQLNSDHDVVDSEITEFSQVIAAASAYGYTYEQASDIYEGLAKAAIEGSSVLSSAIDSFISENIHENKRAAAISDLYQAIGQILLTAEGRRYDDDTLGGIIREVVGSVFQKNSVHTNDDIKIPFSDTTMYNNFLTTMVSEINSNSIKRKHSGVGAVLVPSYDTIQYFEIPTAGSGVEKLMASDVLRRARIEYRQELINKLGAEYESYTLPKILAEVKGIDELGIKYYTDSTDNADISRHLMKTYLEKHSFQFQDHSFFMPSDVVDVFHSGAEGDTHIGTIDLNNLDTYYAFKNGKHDVFNQFDISVLKFKQSSTTPINLRPSTIRWKYIDSKGNEKYANAFDLKAIKDSFILKDVDTTTRRKAVQDALHLLHSGKFSIDGESEIEVIPGTLENKEAELIMGNIFKDTFDVGGASLNSVLAQGAEFFKRKTKAAYPPIRKDYDIAFTRNKNGHTLLSFSPADTSANSGLREEPFKRIRTDKEGNIYAVAKGRNLFQIGKWVKAINGEARWDEDSKKLIVAEGKDVSQYKIHNGVILKRVDYVKRYIVDNQIGIGNVDELQRNDVIYTIVSPDSNLQSEVNPDFEGSLPRIVNEIYNSSDHSYAFYNYMLEWDKGKLDLYDSYLANIRQSDKFSDVAERLFGAQKKSLGKDSKTNKEALDAALDQALTDEANKKWASFQDSLKVISSRIPAQTLQSFMAMKTIGWTENTGNVAHVSHLQIYLQGSDFDIDKSYIMAQNYSSNSMYVGWSNLFDLSSLSTLEASKTLPIPKGYKAAHDITAGVEITLAELNELTTLYAEAYRGSEIDSEKRSKFLYKIGSFIRKLDKTNGRYNFVFANDPNNMRMLYDIIGLYNSHHSYLPDEYSREKSYKNIASANIYHVSHDVRNRMQSYTAISMDMTKDAASLSPKGSRELTMNSLNPMSKLFMQFENITGKNTVGVMANGVKFWFNYYYYWSARLKQGGEGLKYLKLNHTSMRIEGRSKGTIYEGTPHKVEYIPDLNTRDIEIMEALRSHLGLENLGELQTKEIDQALSQLLSAATDNAKELILAKINAGGSMSKMYVYLVVMGYKLNDIAAFMTSPAIEYIANNSDPNIFEGQTYSQTRAAMNKANGIIQTGDLRVSNYSANSGSTDEELYFGDESEGGVKLSSALSLIKSRLTSVLNESSIIKEAILYELGVPGSDKVPSLEKMPLRELMRGFIFASVRHSDIIDLNMILGSIKGGNNNATRALKTYVLEVMNVRYNIEKSVRGYDTDGKVTDAALQAYKDDVSDFTNIYEQATEVSLVTTTFLKLNQGIPIKKHEQIGLIARMNDVVKRREKSFGISDSIRNALVSGKDTAAISNLITKIQVANSSTDMEFSTENIHSVLSNAANLGIMTDFNIVEYLKNNEYRQVTKDYFHLIKSVANIFDMMDVIPHYKALMDMFKNIVVSDHTLSYRSRLVQKVVDDLGNAKYLDEKQLKRIVDYTTKLTVARFLEGLPNVTLPEGLKTDGFNAFFGIEPVNEFSLATQNGLSGFKRFMETDFLTWLKKNHHDNPAVKHLRVLANVDGSEIGPDIDMREKSLTDFTKDAYEDILRGMELFSLEEFSDNYTVADLFHIYNLISNQNKTGAERLTEALQTTIKDGSVMIKYFKFVGELDYNLDADLDYDRDDALKAIAPVVSTYGEKKSTEEFIRVRDNTWGSILKRRNNNGEYSEVNLSSAFIQQGEDKKIADSRRANYERYKTFDFTNKALKSTVDSLIKKVTTLTEIEKEQLISIFSDKIYSGKIHIVKVC